MIITILKKMWGGELELIHTHTHTYKYIYNERVYQFNQLNTEHSKDQDCPPSPNHLIL